MWFEGAMHACHCSVPKKYRRRTEVNWVGTLAYIFFYCAFVFYLWIRITKTLDLGLYVGEHCMCLTALARYNKGLLWHHIASVTAQLPFNAAIGMRLSSAGSASHAGYGVFVLIVEIIGASTVMLYGVNLLWNPVIEKFEEDPMLPGRPKVRLAPQSSTGCCSER